MPGVLRRSATPQLFYRHFATAFVDAAKVEEEDEFEDSMCSPEGEMLWKKGPNGKDVFQLCYAPQYRRGHTGPGGSSLTCDAGTKFDIESPRFCCADPRITLYGKVRRAQPGVEVCADTLAEFNPKAQKIQVVGGPGSSGSAEDHQDLLNLEMPQEVSSPIAGLAYESGKELQDLSHFHCSGRLGTLIEWKDTGRVELCPTGTTPVRGNGWSSWVCDGKYLIDDRFYCCRVKGKLRCVKKFVDQTKLAHCHCPSMGRFKPPMEESAMSCVGTLLFLAPEPERWIGPVPPHMWRCRGEAQCCSQRRFKRRRDGLGACFL